MTAMADFTCRQCGAYVELIDAHADLTQAWPPYPLIEQMIIAYHGSGHRDPVS